MVGKEQIVELYLSGRSVLDTAIELNTSEKRVRKYVLEAGVMRPAYRRNKAINGRARAAGNARHA